MHFPKDSEFVCIEGWSESLYQEALAWVGENRRVAFVAEKEGKSLNPRIKIYRLASPLEIGWVARQVGWSAVQQKMSVIGSASFKEEVEKCHLAADLILSEAADFHVTALKNGRANQGFYRRGLDLEGAFKEVPALIVGAGPSLKKNGHLIRQFAQKGLIFAGGSALNAIDVEPHFAGSIDAIAPHSQFKRHPFSKVPFCYQSRMNPENLAIVEGERILFPDGSSDALNWIHDEEPFDGGWTVGNFMAAVAALMGCSPILFIGMDFAYQEGRKYAEGEAAVPQGLIPVGDLLTQRDWLMAAKWSEERPFFNATAGGILRLPRIDLAEAISHFKDPGDLRQRVANAIGKVPLRSAASRWKEWDTSLESGEGIVEEKLLRPLWNIWRPIFEREIELDLSQKIELHQSLFFERVLAEHRNESHCISSSY